MNEMIIENSFEAAEMFYNGDLTEDELYSLIYQGYVDEEALSEAFDYLEEGKNPLRQAVRDAAVTHKLDKDLEYNLHYNDDIDYNDVKNRLENQKLKRQISAINNLAKAGVKDPISTFNKLRKNAADNTSRANRHVQSIHETLYRMKTKKLPFKIRYTDRTYLGDYRRPY